VSRRGELYKEKAKEGSLTFYQDADLFVTKTGLHDGKKKTAQGKTEGGRIFGTERGCEVPREGPAAVLARSKREEKKPSSLSKGNNLLWCSVWRIRKGICQPSCLKKNQVKKKKDEKKRVLAVDQPAVAREKERYLR